MVSIVIWRNIAKNKFMPVDFDKVNHMFGAIPDTELKQKIAEVGFLKTVPRGELIMDAGSYIKSMPLVLDGKVKVFREDNDGNELFLYYLYAGEACAISLVCTMSQKKSQVRAEALEDTEILMLPIEYMDQFMRDYPAWYRFVVKTYGERMDEMLETIDNIAFRRMDERLLDYLQRTAEALGTDKIKGTHQEIAYELNTSREVVSRLLKQMEKKGMVKLSRNQIELIAH